MPLPTIADVAQRAGVSRQTVSNVLNNPEVVRVETRTRVATAIAELGYRPHEAARRLRMQASSTIAIRLDSVRSGISGAILDHFLHALADRAGERGMRITLFAATDLQAEIEEYARLRDAAAADAIIVTSTRHDDPRIEWLVRERMPFVAFGRPWGSESLDSAERRWVDVDGRAGVAEATRHLARRGLRRIGFLGWPEGSGTGDDRRGGWEAVLREDLGAGDAEIAALRVETEESVSDARVAVESLLRRDDGLEALVCASDSLALGAMMAVREAGRPDFPIIGFDNAPVAQAVGLSSVDQRLGEVATAALELLMGPSGRRVLPFGAPANGPPHRLVTPRLVVRRSSHLAPVEDAGSTASGDHTPPR